MADDHQDAARVDCLLQLLQLRYPDHLTAEQLETLRPDVEGIVKLSSALRAVKLAPHDEPGTHFQPYRSEG